jgi:hypothetical protein
MRATYAGAILLPSYGMSECMSITSPPPDYDLSRRGTSGVACGPELAILDDPGHTLDVGATGNWKCLQNSFVVE